MIIKKDKMKVRIFDTRDEMGITVAPSQNDNENAIFYCDADSSALLHK